VRSLRRLSTDRNGALPEGRCHHIALLAQIRGKDLSDADVEVKPFHLLRVRDGIVRDIPGSAWSATITDLPLKTLSFLGLSPIAKIDWPRFQIPSGTL
jgi:hypothetical protein